VVSVAAPRLISLIEKRRANVKHALWSGETILRQRSR
jgi:hypothetical protein